MSWVGSRKARNDGYDDIREIDAGWTVTQIHLAVKGKVPQADVAAWEKAANGAKVGCPISRLLNTNITMDATLEG